MDQLRRKGTKALKEQFLEITEDEEMMLVDKVKYFADQADDIRKNMEKLLQIWHNRDLNSDLRLNQIKKII